MRGSVIKSSDSLNANLNIDYIDVSYWLQNTEQEITLDNNVDIIENEIIKKESSDLKNYNLNIKAKKFVKASSRKSILSAIKATE